MQQATASATASAFRKKPVETVPESWSGRLDPAELPRPGGMLIAALVQCATERGLTLSEMAAAMGVSHWDISQLRIGFRRLQTLDDNLAVAAAEFLGLPRLTIDMLAGLVDPREALEALPVAAEDLVHACHLLATEPAEVRLAVPLNPGRPLQGIGVEDLAELHRRYGANPAVLDALRAELRYRPPSKTELLRAAVGDSSRIHAESPMESEADGVRPAPGIMRCVSCQTRLRIPHLPEPGEIRCPACKTEYAVHWEAAVCVVQRQDGPGEEPEAEEADGADPAVDDPDADGAWSVLGLEENCPWEDVERARRSLLQHYHPDKLGQVSPLVRKLAEDAFKRVSDAYEWLRARR